MRRWLGAIGALAAGLLCAWQSPPIAKVGSGELSGKRLGSVDAFLGVPYAAPPVGPYRWRAPQPLKAWSGVRAADRFSPSCWQEISRGGQPWTHEYLPSGKVSEDCLYLNVWTATEGRPKRPVLLWIHGGAFSQGSGSVPIYDGARLAARGIVVVDINYRVGPFGFMALPQLTREAAALGAPPTNFGLQDMVAALKWVHANIEAFGGDPDQVTIAGQSAGSMSVHDLVTSPMGKGLFRRAIAESSLPTTAPIMPLADAERAGAAFAKAKGATTLAALRALPPQQLAAAALSPSFVTIVDGVLVREPPARAEAEGRFYDTPMLAGMTADEGSAMSQGYGIGAEASWRDLLQKNFGPMATHFAELYPASTDTARADASRDLLRDRGLGGLYKWSRGRLAVGRQPLYLYMFDHTEPGRKSVQYGAFHSSEIPYIFQTLDASPERPFTAADRALSEQMSRYWVNFVRTGDPNGAGLPSWPKAMGDNPLILRIGASTAARPALLPRLKPAFDQFIAAGGNPDIF